MCIRDSYKMYTLQKGVKPKLIHESTPRRCYEDPVSGLYTLIDRPAEVADHMFTLGDPDAKVSLQLCEGNKVWYEHVTDAKNIVRSLTTPQRVGDALVCATDRVRTEKHSFLSYLTVGEWCISTNFALDMTSSSGSKTGKDALHSTTRFSESESVLL